ncbi:sulfatase-like hydrolase/transferase [Neisseriaceae bacterium ESL0693]|nr:sulfatase-like hydrolase/transferase [Neisseriaceae bacterium ESL0693]
MLTILRSRHLGCIGLLLLNSIIIIYALQSPLTPNRIIETWIFSLLLYYLHPKLEYIYLGLCTIFILVYHPAATLYGRLNVNMVISFFATNSHETIEFLTMIPWHVYLLTITLACIPLIIIYLLSRNPVPCKWRWRSCIVFLIIIGLMTASTSRNKHSKYEFPLRVQPIEFILGFSSMAKDYQKEIKKLKSNLNRPDRWYINTVNQHYRNYVLVIGESARADYHHLYGFKYANTPFMDQHVNLIMDNMIAAGSSTIISLTHGLTLRHQEAEPEFQNNILTLAKKAGMHTIWISNQGTIGDYDLPISIMAHYADKPIFLKKGNYIMDRIHDSRLMVPLQQVLAQSTTQNRLIVLHLMGSHNNPCERLEKSARYYVRNMNSNCYIDTIHQTDDLLRQTYEQLKKTNQPFSLLYFSDHGLSHRYNGIDKNSSILEHNDQFYQNYHIPLVIINSDQQNLVHNPAHRSGLYLIDGLAAWLGIDSPQLPYSKTFFSHQDSENIQVFGFDQQLKSVNTLKDDPLPSELQ